jgi:very-short-patch-repair endonuclease
MGSRKRGIYNVRATEPKRKELRNSLTPAETVLWKHLQRRQLEGKKFRRQVGIGPYIVDFFCPECRVVVELDGAAHLGIAGAEYDARRTEYLEEKGIRVIRFENQTVFRELEWVLEAIRRSLAQPTTPSAPC